MKRKKAKLLVVLLVVMLVGGATAYVGAKMLFKRRRDGWLRDGVAASVAGNNERAAQLLGRFLQHKPRNAGETADYVKALKYFIKSRQLAESSNGRNLAETVSALRLLVSYEPDDLGVRRELLEMYVKLDRWPEALDIANGILGPEKPKPPTTQASRRSPATQPQKVNGAPTLATADPKATTQSPHAPSLAAAGQSWPDDPRTLELKIEILTHMLNLQEALDVANHWVEIAPLDFKSQMARLRLRSTLGHPPDAILRDASALSAAHPGDPTFEVLPGYAYALAYNAPDGGTKESHDNAVAWFTRAANHPILRDDLALALADQFDSVGQTSDAISLLRRIVKNGGNAEVRHTLARRMWEMGDWPETIANLADVDPKNSESDSTLVAFKAIALANVGKKPEMEACRTALAARNQAGARAWSLLLKHIIDAARVDDKQVVATCREALSIDNKNTYLAYYMGDAEARLGELDVAITDWRFAASNFTWTLPSVRVIDAMLQKGLSFDAMRFAQLAARHNRTTGFNIAAARAYAANIETGSVTQTDELMKFVEQVQGKLPGEERTLLLQIQMLAQRGEKTQAIHNCRAAFDLKPAPSEHLLLSLANVSRQFGLGVEQECYTACEKAHGITPALAYAKAIDRVVTGQAAKGLAAFDDLASRSGHSSDMNWKLTRAHYLDVTANPAAKTAWSSLTDAYPNEAAVQQAVVSAQAIRADWNIMQRAIDRLHALTGEQGLEWRLAKARLMVEAPRNPSDFEQGSVLLNAVLKEYPASSEAHVLLARALVQMKRMDGAIEQMTLASHIEPTSVPIALQLAALLQSRGDFDRVRQELDRVPAGFYSQQQRADAAMLLARQGDLDSAVKHLESGPKVAAATTQPSPREDLLLAILSRRNHQPEKAEAIVKKLLEKPDLPTIQFAASLYASLDRKADAEKALALLDGLKLDPGMKELAWGSYEAELGDLSEAAKHYQAATKEAPANAAAWRVLVAAQTGLGNAANAVSSLQSAARALPGDKGFAALGAHAGLLRTAIADAELRGVAMSAIRDPLNAAPTFELLQILLDARQTSDIEHLASQLQQFTERHPESLDAQLQLAVCLGNMGRTNDALAAAQHAMNAFRGSPAGPQIAVQLCARAGRWAEMESNALAWRKRLTGDSEQADVAVATARIRMQQFDSAIGQLDPYLARAKQKPDQHPDLLTAYAVASIGAGKPQVADDLLWPLTGKSAAWRLRWMEVAAELTDPQQVISWLDRVAAQIPADGINEQVGIAEQYERLGTRLHDESLNKKSTDLFARLVSDPKATAIAFLSAGFQAERRGDYSVAESYYRRAVEKDPNLWPAQNNLAMLVERRGGNLKEAATFARAAVALQPRQATLHDTLAQIEAKVGDAKAAADAERLATELDPDNVKWRIRLATFLLDQGNKAAAAQAVKAIESRRLDPAKLPAAERKPMQDQLTAVRKKLGVQAI